MLRNSVAQWATGIIAILRGEIYDMRVGVKKVYNRNYCLRKALEFWWKNYREKIW